jgi:hypothetical protein
MKSKEIMKTLNNDSIKKDSDKIIDSLQKIIDKLSMLICGFGTKNIEDLLFITFGSEFSNLTHKNDDITQKYSLIKKYVHPIGYKIIHWKNNISGEAINNNILCSNKITEEILFIENANMFECFDTEKPVKSFYQKIYGIRVIIQNEKAKKTLVINGIIDDIQINCLNNSYIKQRLNNIKSI